MPSRKFNACEHSSKNAGTIPLNSSTFLRRPKKRFESQREHLASPSMPHVTTQSIQFLEALMKRTIAAAALATVAISSAQAAAITGLANTGTGASGTLDRQLHADGQLSAAVPEPETYAMMLAGIALPGVVARRRRAS
jgi:hypothetical protein